VVVVVDSSFDFSGGGVRTTGVLVSAFCVVGSSSFFSGGVVALAVATVAPARNQRLFSVLDAVVTGMRSSSIKGICLNDRLHLELVGNGGGDVVTIVTSKCN